MTLVLERGQVDDLVAHAVAEAPNECCGVLAGTGDSVARVYRGANAEASPVKYSLAPHDLYRILKEVEAAGWDVVGFYHSHTHSPAYPSETDKKLAFWPESRYVIVSLEDPSRPSIRSFRIVDGAVVEEPVEIAGASQ